MSFDFISAISPLHWSIFKNFSSILVVIYLNLSQGPLSLKLLIIKFCGSINPFITPFFMLIFAGISLKHAPSTDGVMV
ncbi:unnamed protein product [Meloidogyne enterolobii]|uniref:Uncharacterized protein n=1 Tax=Meloidogyne enterolobii TaxID=390850 RepID=A0ACB1AX05_MELEN